MTFQGLCLYTFIFLTVIASISNLAKSILKHPNEAVYVPYVLEELRTPNE